MATEQPAARVMVELSADGSFRLECYRNGQRVNLTLTRGQEWWEILDELSTQKRFALTQAQRKEEQEEKKRKERHNRILSTTARQFGDDFAIRTICGKYNPDTGRIAGTAIKRELKVPLPIESITADDFL
jgi:hypothetical protein